MKIVSMYYKHKEGGFSIRLYRMYKALAGRGHEVHYLACEPFPIDHPFVFFHRIRVPFSEKENFLFWFFFIFIAPLRALTVSLKINAQRIAVFGSWYSVFMLLPRIFLGLKIIVFLRADSVVLYKTENRSPAAKIINYVLEYLGLAISDRIVTNIDQVKRNITGRYGISGSKVWVLYNDLGPIKKPAKIERKVCRNEFGLDEKVLAIATSGIFYKRKNFEFLIHAFAEACLGPDAVLVIIGDDLGQGSERKRLEELAVSLNMAGSVIFTGWRRDSKTIIGSCDLYVLPTLHEGFPNSLLDAMAAGCPCLGSDIEEMREILQYDELLFDLSESRELAERIGSFVRCPEFRKKVADLTGRRAIKFQFPWDDDIIRAVTG